MASIEIPVKISDMDFFKEIISYLKRLDENNPNLEIADAICEICEKHHIDVE